MSERIIFKTPIGYVAQEPYRDTLIYRAMSSNGICLFESIEPAKAIAYAEWFAESKSSRDCRAVIASAEGKE